MKKHLCQVALLVATFAGVCGCVPVTANMPFVQDKLKLISAGYTGCVPAENKLSNVAPYPTGSGTWNATCKGRTYLCSVFESYDHPGSYHCAPVAE